MKSGQDPKKPTDEKRRAKDTPPAIASLIDQELSGLEPILSGELEELPWAPLIRRLHAEWQDPTPPHQNSKLTRAIAEKMIRLVALGAHHEMAYAMGGVAVDTVHRRWFAAAKDGVQPFALFRELLDQADSVAQHSLLLRVYRASTYDWRAAVWVLERRYFRHWGQKQAEQQKPNFNAADPRLHGGPASPRDSGSGGLGSVLKLIPAVAESAGHTDIVREAGQHTKTDAADAADSAPGEDSVGPLEVAGSGSGKR